jgi:hypothetical protein
MYTIRNRSSVTPIADVLSAEAKRIIRHNIEKQIRDGMSVGEAAALARNAQYYELANALRPSAPVAKSSTPAPVRGIDDEEVFKGPKKNWHTSKQRLRK